MSRPRSRPWYLYVLGVLAVTLAALAVAEIGPPASPARTSTQIVTAEKGVVQSTVSGSGNVEAGTDLDMNFQTSGTLSHVYVKVGQHVNKGQLLATLDRSAAQLSLDEAEQNLTAAGWYGFCDYSTLHLGARTTVAYVCIRDDGRGIFPASTFAGAKQYCDLIEQTGVRIYTTIVGARRLPG